MEMRTDVYDFYSLGFSEPYPISGSHGLGLEDLLDAVVSHFGEEEEDPMMKIQFDYPLLDATKRR